MLMTEEKTRTTIQSLTFSESSPFDADTDFTALNRHFETRSLEDILSWSLDVFGDAVAQVTSFGPSGMVILHHLAQINPGCRIITIDTDFLFDETYALWETVQRKYGITIEVHRSTLSPQMQAQQIAPNLWQSNPDHCCFLRKVVPLKEALAGLNAWFTGLRRDQSDTRANLPLILWDNKYQLVKINPLAGWTREQVWATIVQHNIPYNPLHDQGYASIGCVHCTIPATNPADERSGRWHGSAKTECGIHV